MIWRRRWRYWQPVVFEALLLVIALLIIALAIVALVKAV